jgi:hypothetical protein
MKKITYLSLLNLLFISSIAIAQPSTTQNTTPSTMTNTNVQWVCTTNASAGTTTDETNADEAMKKPGQAKAVFDFALTHCRDCTKITCTHE